MTNAVDIYSNILGYPYLVIPQLVIIRAVNNLDKIEALALIRGSYRTENNEIATLQEAKDIYSSIQAER